MKYKIRIILVIAGSLVAGLGIATVIGVVRDDFRREVASMDDPKAVSDSIEAGDAIVEAIGRYHDDNGKLPEDLDALAPRYLDKLPKPIAGASEWRYHSEGSTFVLRFGVGRSRYPGYYWDSTRAKWQLDA